MKKDIMNLVNSENGSLRINHIAQLKRWKTDAIGNKVDCLEIVFDNINGVNYPGNMLIKSRSYNDIITECAACIEQYMNGIANRLISDLRNGYRGI